MADFIETANTEATNTQTPEASGGEAEKLFTQDEVNRIVSDRLAREREKLTRQTAETEQEAALRAREKAVEARESRLKCTEYLVAAGIDSARREDFLEVLDTGDLDRFKAAVDRLGGPFKATVETRGATVSYPPVNDGPSLDSQISAAFKPKI